MRNFVVEISRAAREVRPGFAVVPQNGVELITQDGTHTGAPALAYLAAIDGVGQESLFYGYSADDQPTPGEVTRWNLGFLDLARQAGGIVVLVTDYCFTLAKVVDSYNRNRKKGYVSFAANSRELDRIPNFPSSPVDENSEDVSVLAKVRNFLYLINPHRYATRQNFLDSLKETNYDLLILDLFFEGIPLSAEEVAGLKVKSNGGKRLVLAYLSIGEAEDYRFYWNATWKRHPPAWLRGQDPDWPGNYYVAYWHPEWKRIILSGDAAYLKKILTAGFDGVYLDRIDAFEYFEAQ